VYLFVKALTFDCGDALAQARFWAAVLGSDVDEDSTEEKAFVEAPSWGGPNMWFNRVPEPKTAKNRVHIDVATDDLDALVAHGATVLRAKGDQGLSWTILADPEGNEFCAFTP
jgi:predicted enzyme related to lactoylglutathione lyase